MSASAVLSEICFTNLDADGCGQTVELDDAPVSGDPVNNVARMIKPQLPVDGTSILAIDFIRLNARTPEWDF